MALAFLCGAAACTFDIRLGVTDGVGAIEIATKESRATFAQGGTVVLHRELVIVSEEQSRDYLDRFGADKMDALTGLDLELLSMTVEGGAFAAPPIMTVDGLVFSAPGDKDSASDAFVDDLRAHILAGQEMRAPATFTFIVNESTRTWPTDIAIEAALQPTFHVDAFKAL